MMPMDPDLADMFVDSVQTFARTGVDILNKPAFASTAVTWEAKIEVGRQRTAASDATTTIGRVFLVPQDGVATPAEFDLLRLPTGYPVREAPIKSVQMHSDVETGDPYYIEVSY